MKIVILVLPGFSIRALQPALARSDRAKHLLERTFLIIIFWHPLTTHQRQTDYDPSYQFSNLDMWQTVVTTTWRE